MTITELESLLKRAEDVLGHKLQMSKLYSGKWSIHIYAGPICNDFQDATIDECIAKLKQWATPPKPKMLPVLVPIATAEFAAAFNTPGTSESSAHSRKLSEACREALAPYQQPE